MDELAKKITRLQAEINTAAEKIGLERLNDELAEAEKAIADPDFWQDSSRAQEISKRQSDLTRRVKPWNDLRAELAELTDLIELKDESMSSEIDNQLKAAQAKLAELQKEMRFSGPYDEHDVILSVYAGAGGTDAQDWAQMLLRMYVRWAESQGLKVKTLEQSSGEEAGLKSATIDISGSGFLYAKLAGEHGVHRLVRLSPFNADHKRQTSFAKVDVLPKIDKPSDVEIDDKDLKVDVFRSGGAGGQSVNTTDSAVRVTHLPTGITVAIQNERSQQQNKETALAVLRSRLAALQLEQHTDSLKDLKGPIQSAEWGNQIRSYVLHPYKQVKDNQSGYETTNAEAVLNGELNPLIKAGLAHRS